MKIEKGKGIKNIFIEATSDSELPAMLNAFEIYWVIPETVSATQQDDVDAIWNIRDIYKIPRIDWQGDPCGPTGFRWEGLICGGANNPRIISLNLSSSKLSGRIDAAFSKLTNLEILDLSNNELTGGLPEFLAQLPRLKILNLSQNNLTGLIPESLKEKSNSSLKLRFAFGRYIATLTYNNFIIVMMNILQYQYQICLNFRR
ncbi:putative transferase [Medicago truncatula]|uniref:Putative transferase n=1 Tax=Medicago truncatula TaxID=3880 RepID=A0A396HYY8_MEDTR|nr:putative transferase [Medicago truncatula]